jgi:hypothetical protein
MVLYLGKTETSKRLLPDEWQLSVANFSKIQMFQLNIAFPTRMLVGVPLHGHGSIPINTIKYTF